MNKSWNIVFLAGLVEICWVVGLKHAFNWWTWALTLFAIYVSMHLLIVASKKLPTGTAYAVFTGIGTSGTVVVDMLIFNEPFQLMKILLIALLLTGVIGLKVVTQPEQEGVNG